MIWGYALVWPHQWNDRDPDPWMVRLMALKEHGLTHFMGSVREAAEMDAARRDRLCDMIHEHNLGVTLGFRADFFGDRVAARDDLVRQTEQFLELAPMFRAPIATTGVASVHRFAQDPSLAAQMDALADLLAPVAAACHEAGRPLGIENHGDYYVSDLVDLCQQVPRLGIFLDTGNTYLVGEKPLPAFHEAAPYVVGGHFKDHFVGPETDGGPLRFEIRGATLGTGHVPLRECFEILQAKSPGPEKIAMQIELIPPSFAGEDNIRAFEQSVAFVKGLEEGR